jgi:hypothetical protein
MYGSPQTEWFGDRPRSTQKVVEGRVRNGDVVRGARPSRINKALSLNIAFESMFQRDRRKLRVSSRRTSGVAEMNAMRRTAKALSRAVKGCLDRIKFNVSALFETMVDWLEAA